MPAHSRAMRLPGEATNGPSPTADSDSTIKQPDDSTLTSRRDLLRGAVSIVAAASLPVGTATATEVETVIPPSPTAKAAWQTFEAALAASLAELDEDEFLSISPKRSPRLVQFLDQGAHGMRAETTSNVTSAMDIGCQAVRVGASGRLAGTSPQAGRTKARDPRLPTLTAVPTTTAMPHSPFPTQCSRASQSGRSGRSSERVTPASWNTRRARPRMGEWCSASRHSA